MYWSVGVGNIALFVNIRWPYFPFGYRSEFPTDYNVLFENDSSLEYIEAIFCILFAMRFFVCDFKSYDWQSYIAVFPTISNCNHAILFFLTGLTLIMVNSKSKITCNLVLASSAALVGSVFQFGYNGGVINNAQLVITKSIDESNVER